MVSLDHGLRGPHSCPATACATGLHAIGEAFRQVQRGDAAVMVAGSSEACIDAISINGFARMKALCTNSNDKPRAASRPFDRDRSGFVMAEGAGVLVLESLEHAQRRGARVLAEVRGFGTAGDAHHITQPCPDARGAALAMQRALSASGLSRADVRYINAHATSTPQGDAGEQRAIAEVFGEQARSTDHLLVTSTKGATGHLLGAAGAVEAVFTILALMHRLCPPATNLEHPDDDALPSLHLGLTPAALPAQAAALSNSFGFGGCCTSLLVSSP